MKLIRNIQFRLEPNKKDPVLSIIIYLTLGLIIIFIFSCIIKERGVKKMNLHDFLPKIEEIAKLGRSYNISIITPDTLDGVTASIILKRYLSSINMAFKNEKNFIYDIFNFAKIFHTDIENNKSEYDLIDAIDYLSIKLEYSPNYIDKLILIGFNRNDYDSIFQFLNDNHKFNSFIGKIVIIESVPGMLSNILSSDMIESHQLGHDNTIINFYKHDFYSDIYEDDNKDIYVIFKSKGASFSDIIELLCLSYNNEIEDHISDKFMINRDRYCMWLSSIATMICIKSNANILFNKKDFLEHLLIRSKECDNIALVCKQTAFALFHLYEKIGYEDYTKLITSWMSDTDDSLENLIKLLDKILEVYALLI